jgi:hypothetical protein
MQRPTERSLEAVPPPVILGLLYCIWGCQTRILDRSGEGHGITCRDITGGMGSGDVCTPRGKRRAARRVAFPGYRLAAGHGSEAKRQTDKPIILRIG